MLAGQIGGLADQQHRIAVAPHQPLQPPGLGVHRRQGGRAGGLQKALTRVGPGDPLLLMESLPYGETRAYVEKVMASYWIYRRMFGEPARSIDALASGQQRVGPAMDR